MVSYSELIQIGLFIIALVMLGIKVFELIYNHTKK
jgi:hypothetical protein